MPISGHSAAGAGERTGNWRNCKLIRKILPMGYTGARRDVAPRDIDLLASQSARQSARRHGSVLPVAAECVLFWTGRRISPALPTHAVRPTNFASEAEEE